MADETVSLDAALEAFNVQVRDETARALARVFGVEEDEARAALEVCQWSVTKARKLLEAEHGR